MSQNSANSFPFFHQPFSVANETDELSDNALIESFANALVDINPRARARDQIRDSDKLLHELLLPMSFTWAHPNKPIHKLMPYDLEEMPAIFAADNSNPEYKVHGEFSHLRSSRVPRSTQVAARRSNDPGVVEFTSFFKPSQAQRHLSCVQRRFDPSEDDPNLPGELALRMYREVHERKRKHQLFEQANKKTKLVSFRLGSTSSRSSIFDDVEMSENKLLMLLANFPKFLQEGTRISGPKAFQTALDLGSYNIRPIPPQALASNDTSSKNRIFVGRTRLIWSEKAEAQSNSHRIPYRSLLTGDRLDSTASKRPLRVKVAIRLNGVLLTSNEASARKTLAKLDAALVGDGPLSYSNKVISSALDEACQVVTSAGYGDYSQCSLNTENFLHGVSRQVLSADEASASSLLSRTRHELPIQRQTTCSDANPVGGRGQLLAVPPCIDCVPSEDGIFNVVCTNGGKFIWGSIADGANLKPKHSLCTLLMRELASEYDCCWYVTAAPLLISYFSYIALTSYFLPMSLLGFPAFAGNEIHSLRTLHVGQSVNHAAFGCTLSAYRIWTVVGSARFAQPISWKQNATVKSVSTRPGNLCSTTTMVLAGCTRFVERGAVTVTSRELRPHLQTPMTCDAIFVRKTPMRWLVVRQQIATFSFIPCAQSLPHFLHTSTMITCLKVTTRNATPFFARSTSFPCSTPHVVAAVLPARAFRQRSRSRSAAITIPSVKKTSTVCTLEGLFLTPAVNFRITVVIALEVAYISLVLLF